MERKSRQMSPEQRAKISQALKGRKLTEPHKDAISKKLKAYWDSIPNDPENNEIKTNW